MTEAPRCSVCGAGDPIPLFATHDRLLDLPGTFSLVRCPGCGLIFVHPRPTWAERANHYAPGYRGYHRLATETSAWQRRTMRYGLGKRQRIVAAHLPAGRLLDVGCGGGDFVHWLHGQPGWQAVGLERVEAMARAARRSAGPPIIIGDIEATGLAAGSFDAITLWTVLEHLEEPVRGLAECLRLLRQRGILVVRTVNVASWGARLFGPYWVGYDAPRILTVFTPDTLQRLLSQVGFEVVHMGCHFHDFFPFLWSLDNLCAIRLESKTLRRLVAVLAYSSIARLLSFPFFALQTCVGRNSFVTAVARKP